MGSVLDGSDPKRSTSGDDGVRSTCSLGLLVTEIGGDEERRSRRRGTVRERSAPSPLLLGLGARESDRETVGSGRFWSGLLLNLLIRSLKEGCLGLIKGAVDDPITDDTPKVGESDVER